MKKTLVLAGLLAGFFVSECFGAQIYQPTEQVGTFKTDVISESTSGSGVTVDGVKLKDSEVFTDVIKEKTADTGITLDGVLLKDGTIQNSGGRIVKVTTVNAATYDVLASDYILNVTYSTTGAVTNLRLMTAQVVSGRVFVIKDAGGKAGLNTITITTEGAEKIDGQDTLVITEDRGGYTVYCDGTNWQILH